jgi:hypothetical protein
MAKIAGALQALISLVCAGAAGNEDECRKMVRQSAVWTNDTAVATNTAISERVVTTARQKCRLVSAKLVLAAAVTGTATDFFSVLIDKRTAAAPGTPVNLITFAADTPATDNCVAFAEKDLLGLAAYIAGGSADFELEEGDCITVEITKSTATGMTFPVGSLKLEFEPRSA